MKRTQTRRSKVKAVTPKPSDDSEERLRMLSHDLRNSFSAIRFATYFLNMKALAQPEWEQYLGILEHNLASAELMLTLLTGHSHQEATPPTPPTESMDVSGLLRHLYAQLPSSVPAAAQEKLERIKQMIEESLR